MTGREDFDDRILIERTLAGETDCFGELMKRHAGSVRRWIGPMLRNPVDEDDVIQDVMIKAWRHLTGFRGECTFRTWVNRVAMNEVLQVYRKRRAHRPSCETDLNRLPSSADSPLQTLVRQETARRVHGAAARLPREYSDVLMMRDIEELNTQETAHSLGLSVPAVKSRLFRARRRLSATLAAEQLRCSQNVPQYRAA